jgi:ABC transporter substrate binding protein
VGDPVASGLVAALNQPSGNITGFANYEASMGGKWLELPSEIAPGLKRAAIMFNPDTAPVSVYTPSFQMAARSLKIVPSMAPVHNEVEIETARASRAAALSSWRMHSRSCIARRSYRRPPETTYRRLCQRIGFVERTEDTDPPYPPILLRPRRQRPPEAETISADFLWEVWRGDGGQTQLAAVS